jgi:hypothetical protein
VQTQCLVRLSRVESNSTGLAANVLHRRTIFTDRYSTNGAGKKIFSGAQFFPNGFDPREDDLLSKILSRTDTTFNAFPKEVFSRVVPWARTLPLFPFEGAGTTRVRRGTSGLVLAENEFSAFDAGRHGDAPFERCRPIGPGLGHPRRTVNDSRGASRRSINHTGAIDD